MQSLSEQVLGASHLDEPDAIRKAYSKLAGIEWSEQEFQHECGRLDDCNLIDWDGVALGDQEAITTLSILRQIFTERHIRYSNVLAPKATYRPSEGYYIALGVGLVVSLSLVIVTLPLLKRITKPDEARFE